MAFFYSPCKLVLFFEEERKLISSIFGDVSILALQWKIDNLPMFLVVFFFSLPI